MDKKLMSVQKGAKAGFVIVKILRILLIVAMVLLIGCMVAVSFVSEKEWVNKYVTNGDFSLDLGGFKLQNWGTLIQNGNLTVNLSELKLAIVSVCGCATAALLLVYVEFLLIGSVFKHMKTEETPFTKGNAKRLRVLGLLYFIFMAAGAVLQYLVAASVTKRLGLGSNSFNISLNLVDICWGLLAFFLASLLDFGRLQGEKLASLGTPAYTQPAAPADIVEPAAVEEAPAAPAAEIPAEGWKCPQCGVQNPDSAAYCTECGSPKGE